MNSKYVYQNYNSKKIADDRWRQCILKFSWGKGTIFFKSMHDNTSQKIQKVVKKIVHTTFCGMTGLGFTSFHFLKKGGYNIKKVHN